MRWFDAAQRRRQQLRASFAPATPTCPVLSVWAGLGQTKWVDTCLYRSVGSCAFIRLLSCTFASRSTVAFTCGCLQVPCPAHTYFNTATSQCQFCPNGQELDEDSTAAVKCMDCPGGEAWQSGVSVSAGTCDSCPPGKAPHSSRTSCESCLTNTASPLGKACTPCPAAEPAPSTDRMTCKILGSRFCDKNDIYQSRTPKNSNMSRV